MLFLEDVNFLIYPVQTISNIRYKNYKYNLNQPMQMIERRLKMNVAKNPPLINLLNRGNDHPLVRKNIKTPFND